MFDQFRNVLTPFRKARHPNRNHAEAVIEILPEVAIGDEARQVAAGRGDDADVDLHLLGAADALERLVHQHAENLALCFERHVGEFVDVERSAMGLLERADAACRAGSSSSMPKSSSSMRSGAMVAALSVTKGPLARSDRRGASVPPVPCPPPWGR